MKESTLNAILDTWRDVSSLHLVPIQGQSMTPLIRNRDQVLVDHNINRLRRGDVIVFHRNKGMIAHRVIAISNKDRRLRITTKGDNTNYLDYPVDVDEIIGRAVGVIRDGRHIDFTRLGIRFCGWSIAISAFILSESIAHGKILKQKIIGPQPNKVTAMIRKVLEFFYTCPWRKLI